MKNSSTNIKESAIRFLQLSASTKVREGFKQYVAPDFRHHNAWFKGDADSLMIAMEENAIKNPGKVLNILRVLQDGDLVAIHSHVKHNQEEPGYVLMHIFRFQNDKIVELWDFGQAVPTEMVNENGMF